MKGSALDIVERLSKLDKEYVCSSLSDFFCGLEIPTPFKKQSGLLLLLITKGHLRVKIAYEDSMFDKGDLLVIQPSKPFSIESFSNDLEGISIYIKGDGMLGTMGSHSLIFSLDILDTWSKSKYTLKSDLFEFILNIFNRILKEHNNSNSNMSIVNAYVITLFLELKGIHTQDAGKNLAAIDITRKYKIEVFKTINTSLAISEYANKLSVTTNHLNKAIKTITGMSATQLLSKIKITEAKYLLFRADISVAEVATQVGFDDQSYFSRFFKKQEGISPIDFRKKIES